LKEENPYYSLPSRELALKTFKSEDKYSMSINRDEDGQYWIYCKGAPETIWNLCKNVLVNNK